MTKKNKENGIKAEYYVIGRLNEKGLETSYDDDWYDLSIGEEKIEIKSALLSVHSTGRGRRNSYEYGRFDFSNEDNRNKAWEHNIWLCFVARWKHEFMLLGFQRANEFVNKRYIKISKLREHKLLDIDEFFEEITNEKGND